MEALMIIILFGFLIFCIVGLSRSVSKKAEADKIPFNEAESRYEKVKTEIFELEAQLSATGHGHATNVSEAMSRLYYHSERVYRSFFDNYLHSNNIKNHEESHSSLGVCGVSATDFWYNLDKSNSNFNSRIFNAYEDGKLLERIDYLLVNAKKTIGSPVEIRDGGMVGSYADNAGIEISRLKAKVDFYKLIQRNQILFNGNHIPLENIQCFRIDGTTQYVSEVSGGGVNLHGAVAGAIIAGDAGAIIGSHMGTETKTNISKKDDRRISLIYSENGIYKTMNIQTSQVDAVVACLRKLIPQKEDKIAQLTQAPQISVPSQLSNADELRKYKELLDDGVVSQEEFDAKKKQLLGL